MFKHRLNTISKTSKRSCYVLLTMLMVFGILSFIQKKSIDQPNVIIVLVDDAGYADFGFMGAKDLSTPNLDALAMQSVRFTDAHVTSSVCSPSRAGILTGKYQQRFGYECNEGDGYTGIDTLQQLIPTYLKKVGYTTAAFGKWHLGYQQAQHPLSMGFDYYYGFLSGARSYFYKPNKDDAPQAKTALLENFTQVSFNGYLTDVLGTKAASFIHANKSNPFFMYWAPNAVHTPMEADSEDLKKFEGHKRKTLAAMTLALDRAVGTIVNQLKKDNIFDNTIIIFLSDNGGAHNNQSNNGKLKGFKGNEYEAGHRVPLFMSWPKKIREGKTYNGLSSSLDILPTVLEAAAVQNYNTIAADGVSWLPYVLGNAQGQPHQALIWRKDAAAAIRMNNYKLIRVNGIGYRLYDLQNDISESNDLQASNAAMLQTMQAALLDWEKSKMKPLWQEGNVWDTITLMIHDDLMHNRKVRVRNPEELANYLQHTNNNLSKTQHAHKGE